MGYPPTGRNPFRIDRLESLAFRPHARVRPPTAWCNASACAGWHGAVVGPHGSGKSTLLKRLVAAAAADGHPVTAVFVNRQTPRDDAAGRGGENGRGAGRPRSVTAIANAGDRL